VSHASTDRVSLQAQQAARLQRQGSAVQLAQGGGLLGWSAHDAAMKDADYVVTRSPLM
jgi:hypothetical protein